jgi:Zn-dependent protease/CBS domain-containing protein
LRNAWRIGRVFGIDIKIDSSWLVIFILFSWSLAGTYFPKAFPGWSAGLSWAMGLMTSLLVFASVLFHELSHSLVAQKQGEKVTSVTLFLLGGVSQISEEPNEPLKEFSMALAGPVSSFVLAGVFFGLSLFLKGVSQPLGASARYLAIINAGLGIFNLLPGFPMDGGRVLRSIIWKITGDIKKATRIASMSGQGFAFLLMFLGVGRILKGDFGGLWFILIGWFLQNASVRGYEQVAVKSALQGMKAKDLMTTDFETVHPGLPVQRLVDEYILKKRERVFLVTGLEGGLEGIICLEDVKATPREKWPEATVGEIMTPRDELHAVGPEADGNEILARLTAKDVHQLPVMDGDKIAGIICRTDVLRAIQLRNELGV